MKIGTGGCGQTEPGGMRGKRRILLRLVAAGDDFDRSAPMLAKFAEQFAHLRIIELVAAGMRDDGQAAAAVDPLHRIAQTRPLVRHKTRLTRAEITLERAVHVLDRAALDQKPREMGTG